MCCDPGLLPEVVVLEILARLSVQELVRFQCVCRAWRDAARDPGFIRRHRELRNKIGGPKSNQLLLSCSEAGTLLLDPFRHDAWAVSPCFACPTNPTGLLLGATGGLLCYDTRENIDGRQLNLVVWNPITKECLRIPTLHPPKPEKAPASTCTWVSMVVRQGRLCFVVVNLAFCLCVYDCSISKEAMEKRIASSGKVITRPLPNLWMELVLPIPGAAFVSLPGSSKLASIDDYTDALLDLDDFSLRDATRVAPPRAITLDGNFNHEDDFVYVVRYTAFEYKGALGVFWSDSKSIFSFILCSVAFTQTCDAGLVSHHEPLVRIDTGEISSPLCDIAFVDDDKLLLSFMFFSEEEADKAQMCKWEGDPRTCASCIVSGVDSSVLMMGRSSGVPRVVGLDDGVIIPCPLRFRFLPVRLLEPSLTDSPGSLPLEKQFSWDMVHFPDIPSSDRTGS